MWLNSTQKYVTKCKKKKYSTFGNVEGPLFIGHPVYGCSCSVHSHLLFPYLHCGLCCWGLLWTMAIMYYIASAITTSMTVNCAPDSSASSTSTDALMTFNFFWNGHYFKYVFRQYLHTTTLKLDHCLVRHDYYLVPMMYVHLYITYGYESQILLE